MRKRAALMGGDLRQVRLAQLLRQDGWDIITWGLEKGGLPGVPLDQAVSEEVVILPLPVLRGEELNFPLTDTTLSADELWGKLRPGQLLLGGSTGELSEILQERYGLTILDYYDREDVQIANAVPTAEGAIMRMMEMTEYTVQDSRCLVIGYGRIGKALAQRLQTLGAVVTVSARRSSDLAWVKACGFRAAVLGELDDRLGDFDVIFNTVPSMMLDEKKLGAIKTGALLVELASFPGGFDLDAVKEKNLQLITERGLPGKVAPLSAARFIRDGIYRILEERGEIL